MTSIIDPYGTSTAFELAGQASYPPGEGEPPWLLWALRELATGVREIPGKTHNPRVLYYHSFTRLRAKTDEVPWCSAFVCAAFENVDIASTRSAAAKSWVTWGQPCDLKDGAVIFFPKSDPDAGGTGHVALYYQGRALGGNQGNRVSLADKDMSRAVARWPAV